MRNNFTLGDDDKEDDVSARQITFGVNKETPAILKAGGIVDVGRLAFNLLPASDGSSYMGRTWRSAITGEIRMSGKSSWPHFDLADMWTREHLYGSLRQYLKDKHVFLPLPMPYRTWIYHDLFLEKKVMSDASENGMVYAALKVRCIDVPVNAGLWSPIMCYAPMLLMLCLTGDMFVLIPAIFLMLVLYLMSKGMNNPASYRYLRLATLLPRMGFLVVVILRAAGQAQHALGMIAYLVALILLLVDLWKGDLQTVWCYRLNCHYEVIKDLPGRVFICRRHGASHLEHMFGDRGQVDEMIHGMGTWNRNFYLIADINGMLAELRPVHVDDLLKIYDEWCEKSVDLSFYALDSFGVEFPTVRSIGVSHAELQEQCKAFLANVPRDALLYAGGGLGDVSATADNHWAKPAQPEVSKILPKAKPPNMVVETDF